MAKRLKKKQIKPQTLYAGKIDYSEDESGVGFIEGYAAVFDNVDRQGEVIRPGAFTKTINEAVKTGKVLLMVRHFAHGGDVLETIGKVIEAEEDETGLYIKAQFSERSLAQEVRSMAKEGLVTSMSIGYETIQERSIIEEGITVTELIELKLGEVTLTNVPANELAIVTGAKSLALGIERIKEPEADMLSALSNLSKTISDVLTKFKPQTPLETKPMTNHLEQAKAVRAEIEATITGLVRERDLLKLKQKTRLEN